MAFLSVFISFYHTRFLLEPSIKVKMAKISFELRKSDGIGHRQNTNSFKSNNLPVCSFFNFTVVFFFVFLILS